MVSLLINVLILVASQLRIIFTASNACLDSSDPLIRCTSEGLIRGKHVNILLNRSSTIESSSVDAFLGVPYGEAPVGERRFRKPLGKQPWSRSFVYNATHLSNSCYQMIIDFLNATGEKIWAPLTPMSEDCLYLNIWAPSSARQQQQPLAVMVWIYGGGFTSGSSTLKLYDGSILSATQNVVVVSIEYRVESLGFLYLGTSDAPGNQGLFDQQLALEWIQSNIHAFGGDRQRITLFGESAGAVSVGLHLLAPKSRPLFHNAILQSSGPTAKWAVLSPQIAKYRSEKFLNAFARYVTERPPSDWNPNEYALIPFECQRTLRTVDEKFRCVKSYPIISVDHFRSLWAMESYNGDPIGYTFVPTIDAEFIPYDPEQMLSNGDWKRTSILLGVNQDEGSYFNVYLPFGNLTYHSLPSVDYPTFQSTLKEYFRHIPTFPIKQSKIVAESILQMYTVWNDMNNPLQNAIQLNLAVGDYHLTCPTILLADVYAKENLPVYFYYFTLRSSVSPWHPWMGVLHADELMFVFGEPLNITDDLSYTHEEMLISEKMMNYWANFAKYSNPNQIGENQWANEWRQYRWPEREHIVLSASLLQNLFPEHGSALRASHCSFWLDFLPKLTTVIANISDQEQRWKEEFHQYEERIQQWDYHYLRYSQMLEKSKEKFFHCLG